MKIIYHHRTQAEDAQGIHIHEMIKAFKENDHEVFTFSLVRDDAQSSPEVKGKFWQIIKKLTPYALYEILELTYNLLGYFKLKNLVKKIKPDFIYERYSLFNFCGVLLAKKNYIPIILEVNAPLYYEKSVYEKLFFKKFAKSIENWICNNATHAITVTKVLKDMLVKQGVDANNVSVIHNGINQEEFKNNLSGDEIRNKYSFGQNELVIGMVGWFRDWHGLDLLIDACHQKNLFKKENIKLLLVGDGPAVVKNKKKVKDLSLENYVIFTGAIQRTFISKYIAALDIAIQPRVTSYACPMKIIEYMAAGKAIVAPDQPNIRELLKDNYNAFLFKPEDLNDLFTKIDLLIEDAKSRNFISKNAKITLAEKNLFWFENAKRVVNLLNNLN